LRIQLQIRETPRCDPRINFLLCYPSKTLVSLPIGVFNLIQLKPIYK
jgi:hypothetical protein